MGDDRPKPDEEDIRMLSAKRTYLRGSFSNCAHTPVSYKS